MGGGDYDYYDSDGQGQNVSYDIGDDSSGDDDDDDLKSIESDSVRRTNIISDLRASSLQSLSLSGELWESSLTMESFQPDVENIIAALQSNCSLESIEISREILAAIGESKQGRLFYSLGSLPTLQNMTLYGGVGSHTAIHTRALADSLSETSNARPGPVYPVLITQTHSTLLLRQRAAGRISHLSTDKL
jgi:hypothetical protein